MAANTYLTPEERAALESARVGIAGAGGLGSNCAMHLVRAGVKHLTVVDFDVVNESNLNRQFFFRDQLGQKKVEALKENLLKIEPDVDIRTVDMRLDASSARELFADCGIVVEAFDAVDAKVMLVSAFASSGKKLVTASGLAGPDGGAPTRYDSAGWVRTSSPSATGKRPSARVSLLSPPASESPRRWRRTQWSRFCWAANHSLSAAMCRIAVLAHYQMVIFR